MRRDINILFILTFIIGMCLGGCNVFDTSPTLVPVEGSNHSKADDLIGPTWQLVDFQTREGHGHEFEIMRRYTVQFHSDGNFEVTGACNTGFGNYQARNGGSINISKLGHSQAGCHESEGIYFRTLIKVKFFKVSRNQLKLGFGEQGVLLYHRKE